MQLVAENISVTLGDRVVLREVSLALSTGRVMALIGPNGAGKSTLIRRLLGLIGGAGRVLWEGQAVEAWSPRALARRVAYLPQFPTHDSDDRVLDVLRLGRTPYLPAMGLESLDDSRVVHEVAEQLELLDLLDRRMDRLSGGQRQRALLGRCLVQQPVALLLDEPSSFLDLRHQYELARLLRRLAREKNLAVLMASHDLPLASVSADELVLLDGGRVVAAGPPRQVLDADLLSRVYQVPLQVVNGGVSWRLPSDNAASA